MVIPGDVVNPQMARLAFCCQNGCPLDSSGGCFLPERMCRSLSPVDELGDDTTTLAYYWVVRRCKGSEVAKLRGLLGIKRVEMG